MRIKENHKRTAAVLDEIIVGFMLCSMNLLQRESKSENATVFGQRIKKA